MTGRDLGGLVLAGGRGRRFGGPKALAELGGVTLVERAVATLQPFCAVVVVAAHREVPLPEVGAIIVEDPEAPRAAMIGLASGLAALDTADVLVLACDLVVDPSLIDRLLAAPDDDAIVADERGAQPLCARYRRVRARDACRSLIAVDDLRVRRLVELLHPAIVTTRPGELRNVNTRADLEAVAKRSL